MFRSLIISLTLLTSLFTTHLTYAESDSFGSLVETGGFYIISARLANNAKEGMWSFELNHGSTNLLSGGAIHAGAMLYENGAYPGFFTFQLEEAEAIKLTPAEYTGEVETLNMRILTLPYSGEREEVQLWTNVAPGTEVQTAILPKGSYLLEIFSAANSGRGRFGLSINAPHINENIGVGGWLDSFTSDVPEGFVAVYVPYDSNKQFTRLGVRLNYGDAFGEVGADKPELTIYQQAADGALTPVSSSTDTYFVTQQLVNNVNDWVPPAVSDDGGFVAYVAASSTGYSDLFLFNLQNQTTTQITDVHSLMGVRTFFYVHKYSITSDSRYLIYNLKSSYTSSTYPHSCTIIHIYELSTAQDTSLEIEPFCTTTDFVKVSGIGFNTETQMLSALVATNSGASLKQYDLSSGGQLVNEQSITAFQPNAAHFSADSNVIVFSTSTLPTPTEGNSADIYRYVVDTGELTLLSAENSGLNTNPSISTDGNTISFINQDNGETRLLIYQHIGETRLIEYTTTSLGDKILTGEIQDKFIVTERTLYGDRRSRLFLNLTIGGVFYSELELTTGADNDSYSPSVSPNGRYVAFYSYATRMRDQTFDAPTDDQKPALYLMTLPYSNL